MMTSPFRILSIDGGGFRGLFAAHILARLEEEYAVDWRTHFDLFAGTSTGAIIAAAIAVGKPAAEIERLYLAHGPAVFRTRWYARLTSLANISSKYSAAPLAHLLRDILGDITLSDVNARLVIPSTDIGNASVHIFKSNYLDGLARDGGVKVRDAVMASCAAPTYFPPYALQHYLLADGGLWANNPSLVATLEAICSLNIALKQVRILSLGSGTSHTYYRRPASTLRRCYGWGFLTRWRRARFIEMLLNLSSESAWNCTTRLLSDSQHLRLTFESDGRLPLDDPSMQDTLLSKADRTFSHESETIRQFLALKSGERK
jgi:hypothetical protein